MRSLSDWLNDLDPRAKSWHPKFIANFADILTSRSYLEVGVYRGETLRLVSKRGILSVGVDIDSKAIKAISGIRGVTPFLGTVQEFSASRVGESPSFDLAFIDANHERKSVVEDFIAVEAMMSPNGFVLLHDTWPGSLEFTSQQLCGDAYLAVNDLRSIFAGWNFVTISKHPGLTIAQRVSSLPF
jgi:predicted O-methyltransferase YrrM